MNVILIVAAILIIAVLGFYAGKLLFQLKQQQARQAAARQERVDNITLSIRTIALAMEQQQCDLSEGVIRLCNLLDAIPLLPQPDYPGQYPAIHGLYDAIKHYPTHEARNQLTKQERRKQDKERENIAAQYESEILKELQPLKTLTL